ncbi:MAG: HAD-IIIA family hydrolase [Victivallales bacterium]|nr:HAD-IIIA family hydrolase [Victivallales bacterium]
MDISAKFAIKRIRTIVLDVDGVLTDGRFGYDGSENEIKFFHARDGHGIKLAMRAGFKVGIMSGRAAKANRQRAEELGLSFVYEGEKDKRAAFDKMLQEQSLRPEECLYMGDDIVDIPPMKLAGIAVTVADAPEYMDEFCDIRTSCKGGHGAVREVIDILLKEQNKWNQVAEKYLG